MAHPRMALGRFALAGTEDPTCTARKARSSRRGTVWLRCGSFSDFGRAGEGGWGIAMGRGGDSNDVGLESDPSAVLAPSRIPGYRGFIPGGQQYVVHFAFLAARARVVL